MIAESQNWSAKGALALGFAALVVLVGGLGAWSITVTIAGAVITSGVVEVETNRQIVQHPNGGVIAEILIEEGDQVESGDILIRFDDGFLQSELTVISEQLFEIFARKSRLVAERDGVDTVLFAQTLVNAKDNPVIAELMIGQQNLFFARAATLTQEAALLNERGLQIAEQIKGAEAQRSAVTRQRDLIGEELADENALLAKGLSKSSIVRGLQREAAHLAGQEASLLASIAERRGRIAEIEIEVLRLHADRLERAIATLRDLQYREIELREAQKSLRERLQRLAVRAPSSGIVYDKQFHALRSVVRAAEPILYIIPQDVPLVITTKVQAIHIDQVHIGQVASLLFPAFDRQTMPEVLGAVTRISPDVFIDELTGVPYYRTEILPVGTEAGKLEGLILLPGMPAQVFLRTTDRTPFEYLLKPIADYFRKSFRGA